MDGSAHAPELGLEEDDVAADAGEQRVLLLQQLAELPRQRVHHARQRAHHDVHLAGADWSALDLDSRVSPPRPAHQSPLRMCVDLRSTPQRPPDSVATVVGGRAGVWGGACT